MNFIDHFIDTTTMYRLMLYYLIALLIIALGGSFFGFIPYSPMSLVESISLLLVVCWITNKIFARVFEAPTNVESVYISALILALIVTPVRTIQDIPFLGWIAVWTIASKFILAINKKHIFNPVAIGAVIASYGLLQAASWWVGDAFMVPFVLLGGILIARKIRHTDMIFSFLFFAVGVTTLIDMTRGSDIFASFQHILLHSAMLFFAFVMLAEPLTTPPTKKEQLIYGGMVGLLFSPQAHIGSLYFTPELALVTGNIYSYIVSPKFRLKLFLQQKIQSSRNEIDFIFSKPPAFSFLPGQYMEWTLPHQQTDSRGNRRYFTLSSSPTEDTLRLGVRFYDNSSSFKKAMLLLNENIPVIASQLSGEFTLPQDMRQKVVFIAGGIGITPYRSMIKYLLDTKQTRPIVLLYANKTADEIMYKDVFDQAQRELGIPILYTLTDLSAIPHDWQGKRGRIDAAMISDYVSDYKQYLFYLSGPHTMVTSFERVLKGMGVGDRQIKIDFFPGLV